MITWLSDKKQNTSSQHGLAKDDFTSLSSHELRSPLSIIKWYTEILLDEDAGPLNEAQKKYLAVIETSNQRAIDLVRSLLNVSRLELGTFSLSPEEVNFSLLVDEVLASLQEYAFKKEITLTFLKSEVTPLITLDKRATVLIVKQLATNAIIFSKPHGEVTLTVSLIHAGEFCNGVLVNEDSIVLSVADNGIGIPEEDHDKIFSKMFKAGNVNDSEISGSGLGLYILKTLVDYFGGSISFTSQKNVGTTFFVSFPLRGMPKKEGRTTLD